MLLYELVDVSAKLADELKTKDTGKMQTEQGEEEQQQQKKKSGKAAGAT